MCKLLAAVALTNPVDVHVTVNKPLVVADAAYARRVYLDAWGLVPTPEEAAAFESDRSPNKRAALVDRLLANNKLYADHWITFWNDHLRNDEGVIYHGDRKTITAWLHKALAGNLPYDKFVRALIDPAAKGDPDGFVIGVNWRGDVSASELPPIQAAQNSAQVFLGVNLKCNSCHDSFISKWKLKDAYGLASFFSEKPLPIYRCDVPTGETAETKFLFPELGKIPRDLPFAQRRKLAADLFTSSDNIRLRRTIVNRIWRRLMGRGLVEPVDDIDAKSWNPELLDELAKDFAASGYDMKHLMRRIMTSRAYQLPSAAETRPYVFEGPLPRRLSAEQFADSISAITGEWRVRQAGKGGEYAREWQVKSTSLTRALGRPIRDQVNTSRLDVPTTLQALELVNGETLANALHRGAQRILGQLKPMPPNIFDSGLVTKKAAAEFEFKDATKLWLLTEDSDSFDRARTLAGWTNIELTGPAGSKKLANLTGGIPAEHIVDVTGYTKLRAEIAVDPASQISEINPRVRFFAFTTAPNRDQLVNVKDTTPLPVTWTNAGTATADQVIDRLYRHALGRPPAAGETQAARRIIGVKPTANSLEDLLWSVFLSPEFEYIR